MNRGTTIVWLFLILLTTASWLLAERHAAAMLLMGLAALKLSLVTWWFMELRRAYWLWPVMLGVLLLGITAGVLLLA